MPHQLPTPYQQFIHKAHYARWIESEGRREEWEETVERYFSHFDKWVADNRDKPTNKLYKAKRSELKTSVLSLHAMPSMRAMMTAGPALERCNVAGYNCAYMAVDSPRSFDEAMYISLCGTGVGFSVERQYISKLPDVPEELYATDTVIKVHDSKLGWAKAFKELLGLLWSGAIPGWDVSAVRPAGSRLKTFGGRASGPGPLVELFNFSVKLFGAAKGRKLTSIECHDLMCKVADIVVSGGVRRSAMISLSNLSDDRMRSAKTGQWWTTDPQRALANNSYVATERPDMQIFLKEWTALFDSRSGERGIFNRKAAQKQAAKTGRRDPAVSYGCNPCSEIILKPMQFCNLSEVVVRATDSLTDLLDKVHTATVLGTLQATQTDFKYLRAIWQRNTEEEALLGVSLTGIMDHPVLNKVSDEARDWVTQLRECAIESNKTWADILGINRSTSITCVKPSGSVSQLVDSASGLHARYSPYYIRTVRADVLDPLSLFLISKGFPFELGATNKNQYVFSFPIKSPDGSVVEGSRTALEALEHWKMLQDDYCEHKPSMTCHYKEEEFLGVGNWLYQNFDSVSGISFLPLDNHAYVQAPYQAVTKEQYDELVKTMPAGIDWTEMSAFEREDNTVASQTLACSGGGGSCEIDLAK